MAQTPALRLTLRTHEPAHCVRVRLPLHEAGEDWRPIAAACAGAVGSAVEWLPDLVERLVRAGRPDEARSAFTRLAAHAEETGDSSALAATARCRGLLASDVAFDRHFAEALALHTDTASAFERARTELCYGERLRRARRRAESRAQLRAAVAAFERLGAEPWAARARRELEATGETMGRHERCGPHDLTPQEFEIALLVARGSTNKEVAATLFLSPKTIEAHLGRIYRKLGLRSRTQLAHRLAHGVTAA